MSRRIRAGALPRNLVYAYAPPGWPGRYLAWVSEWSPWRMMQTESCLGLSEVAESGTYSSILNAGPPSSEPRRCLTVREKDTVRVSGGDGKRGVLLPLPLSDPKATCASLRVVLAPGQFPGAAFLSHIASRTLTDRTAIGRGNLPAGASKSTVGLRGRRRGGGEAAA
eukprot:3920911-Rhodomonas_salina.4